MKSFPKGSFKFTTHGGVEIREGEVYYPNLLRLTLDRPTLVELLRIVASQIENGAGGEDIDIALSGLLEPDESQERKPTDG
jgi:hypothetical protein